MRRRIWFVVIFLAFPAFADFERGYKAYESRDYVTAFEEWELAAEQGDPRSQYFLSELYLYGRGVSQDRAKAWSLLRKAAESGHVFAMLEVAKQYSGDFSLLSPRYLGVSLDLREAYIWATAAFQRQKNEDKWKSWGVERALIAIRNKTASTFGAEERRKLDLEVVRRFPQEKWPDPDRVD